MLAVAFTNPIMYGAQSICFVGRGSYVRKKKQSFLKSGENFKKKIKKINVEKKLELK